MLEMREEIINTCLEEVRRGSINSTFKLASLFLYKVRESVKTLSVPDAYKKYQGIFESVPRMVAIKRLPSPVRGASWSSSLSVTEDVVTVEEGDHIDDEYVRTEGARRIEEGRLVPFLLLSEDEQEEIIEWIKKYIIFHLYGSDGPLLGAIYAVSCRADTPSEEWNRVVRQLLEKEEEEDRLAEERYLSEMRERAERVAKALQEAGIPARVDWCGDFIGIIYGKGRREEIFWNADYEEYFLRCLEDFKAKEAEFKRFWSEEVPLYLEGKKPVFKVGSVEVFLKGNVLEVPENLIPRLIGRWGKWIKVISDLVGCRVWIRKLPAVPVSRKASIWRLRLPKKPRF
jgi:hypothetical protein